MIEHAAYARLAVVTDLLLAVRGQQPRPAATISAPVAITLTSYPPRFQYLHLTLRSLLRQSMPADRVILWITDTDGPALPKKVRNLTNHGLDIRFVDELRSYKKLVPAIEAFPDHFLAIADDDMFYPKDWLATLLRGYRPHAFEIPCLRGHRISTSAEGSALPYRNWHWDVQEQVADPRLVPTGVGGVLYPPKCLHPDAVRQDLFREICPTTDDLWFYWMARRNGYSFRKVGRRFALKNWPGTLDNGLFLDNLSRNDRAFNLLEEHFGRPY